MKTQLHNGKEIGARIKAAAEHAGLTLPELAKAIGVSRPTIYAYAAGSLRVSNARLRQIAEATNQTTSFFNPPPSSPVGDRPLEELVDALLSNADLGKAVSIVSESLRKAERTGRQSELAGIQRRLGNALLLDGNYLEAVGHLQGARLGFLSRGMPKEAAQCSQSLGYAFINTGRLEMARQCFEEAFEFLDPSGRWKAEVSLAALDERSGRLAEAAARLDNLEKQDQPPAVRAYILANRASISAAREDWTDAEALNRQALALATSPDQIIERTMSIGRALFHQGNLEEASLWLLRASDAASLEADQARMTFTGLLVARLLFVAGMTAEARRMAVEWQRQAIRHEHRRSEASAIRLLSEIAFARGDFENAIDVGLQGTTFCYTHQYPYLAVRSRAVTVGAMCRAGDIVGARRELDALLAEHGSALVDGQRAAVLAAEAMVLAAEGRMREAWTSSQKAVSLAMASGDRLMAWAEAKRGSAYAEHCGADARQVGTEVDAATQFWQCQDIHWIEEGEIRSKHLDPPHWTAFANP